MPNRADYLLMAHVQRQLNSGTTHVVISAELATQATPETLEEVRQLAKLAGASVEVAADE